jgi:subtilisin family serine protease
VSYTGQPAVSTLHLNEAQSYTQGEGVKVAVIDTGVDLQHPLFAGRIAWPVYDFVDGDEDPTDVGPGVGYGHGTFVAGLIVLAAPRATIMPLRAFGTDGYGTSFNIAKAIRFAADNGARVINMSFGMSEEDSLVKDAIVYAGQKSYMVAAAGNDNGNFIHFPASLGARTLSVTSTAKDDVKAPFSNFASEMNVSAPGVSVYSAYPGKAWAYWSGTSFSTALVSGEAALLIALKPESSRTDLNTDITWSGTNIDTLNPDYAKQLGKVRVDYQAAILRQLNLK